MATNCKVIAKISGNGDLTGVNQIASAASGSSFAVLFSVDNGALPINSVTDNKGNTFTRVDTGIQNLSRAETYVCQNGAGGSGHTFTVDATGGTFGPAWLVEIPNAGASSLDIHVSGADSSTPYTLASGTLAQADEELLGIYSSGSMSGGSYASSNTTILDVEENESLYWPACIFATTVASTSSFVASLTGGSDNGVMMMVSFKISAGPGPGPSIKQLALLGVG